MLLNDRNVYNNSIVAQMYLNDQQLNCKTNVLYYISDI